MSSGSGFKKLALQISQECERDVIAMEAASRGDSPIEKLMFAAMVATSAMQQNFGMPQLGLMVDHKVALDTGDVGMYQQFNIEAFRVDFLFAIGGLPFGLVVECDGHDFHERTKEQAKRDRARDRRLQQIGYTVFRFTGSELWNDPRGCAIQVWAWLNRQHYRTSL
jgi:very-short-patch-repair endonuclease